MLRLAASQPLAKRAPRSGEFGIQRHFIARQILLSGRADDREVDVGASVTYRVACCRYVRSLLAGNAVSNLARA